MKSKRNVLYSLLILLAGAIYYPMQAQQKNGDQDVVYQLDVKKSKLFWKAPGNKHNGFILFNSGTLSHVTAGWPTQGTFIINMNSMRSTDETTDAGRKKVDDELRSEGFFAVSKYPVATMVVNKILPEANGTTYKVYGELMIKNIIKPVEFTTVMKLNDGTFTATANMNINRKKWNINHQPQATPWDFIALVKDNFVDDEIPISLELVFTKK